MVRGAELMRALMPTTLSLIAIFVASAALTWLMRRFALRYGIVDVPNQRSSHDEPTPRGGGMAIALVTTAVLAWLCWRGALSDVQFYVLGAGGMGIALLGFLDDWRSLSTHQRLGVHLIVAVGAAVLLGGLPPLRFGEHSVTLGWFGHVVCTLGIVWMLNLFNFMDGIDGLAASEGAFVGIAGAMILGNAAGLTLGIACAGFLIWNWPPARVFMGDAGSGYLGFCIAGLAIIAGHENPVAMPVFLILSAVFVVDATVTFVRRIARNERYDVGHRTHGYQRLARHWGSHRAVTLSVLLVNVVLLLPAATWAARNPARAAAAAFGVVCLLFVVAVLVGSGKQESRPASPGPRD